jgi:PAS domain S-box-containing protein
MEYKAMANKKYSRDIDAIIAVLFEISNAVASTDDLDELYESIHASLKKKLNLKNFAIAIYHKERDSMTFPYFVDEVDTELGEIFEVSKKQSLSAQVINAGKPMIFYEEDIRNMPNRAGRIAYHSACKVWAGAPIKIKDRTFGALLVQSYRSKDAIAKSDLHLLNSVAEFIAISIERKQIQIASEETEKINQTLQTITNAVHTTENLSELYRYIRNSLGRLMDSSNFFIALYDSTNKSINFEYFADQYDKSLPRIESLAEANSLTGEVIIEKKPLLLKEDMLLYRAKKKKIVGTVPKIWLGVPLNIKGEVIGVVAVQSYSDANLYNENDLQVLTAISDQIAIAIHRKRAKDELQESEALYRLLADSVSDVVWTRDMALNLNYVSPSVETQTGFSVKEKMAQPLEEGMPPDSVAKIIHILDDEIKLEREGTADPDRSRIVEIESYRKDGTIYPMESVVSFMRDTTGKAIALAGINRDITDRKKADEALRLTFETSPDVIVINRLKDGLFVDINQSFINTTGYTRDEAIGKTTLDLNIWHDPTDLKRLVKGLQKKGKIVNAEAKFRCKDGSIITGLMSASLIELNDQPHIINITRNIESIKKAQKEKVQLQAHLLQAQKMEAIGTLAGGIAHDFNNILSGILGYSELIQEDLNVLDCKPKTHERMRRVIKASLRAKNLVTQILDFSRSTRKDPTPISVILIVKEVLQLLRASLPSSIKIEQAIGSDSYVMADPTSIHQILMNLCTNAKDAMLENGGTLTLQLKDVNFCAEDVLEYEGILPGHFLLISVKDTGHGMEKEVIERILEPFYTTKINGKGTGMGLSVVHGIVKSLDGFIKIFSTLGQGSRFDVFLPVHEKNFESNHKMMMEIKNCEGEENILVIDDEETLAEMIRDSLEHFGYKATFFSSSEEALEHFKKNSDAYDLIISDITMPDMTGDILVEQISLIHPGIPVILLTGFNELVNNKKAESLQINALLYKPVPAKEMLSTIRAVLDQKMRDSS